MAISDAYITLHQLLDHILFEIHVLLALFLTELLQFPTRRETTVLLLRASSSSFRLSESSSSVCCESSSEK